MAATEDMEEQKLSVPNGPGATVKSPGRDGTTKRRPFSFGKPQDGGPYNGDKLASKTVGDYGGLLGKVFLRHSIILCAKQK